MRIQEIDFDARPPIDAYGGGGFRVAGEKRLGSMLLLPAGGFAWGAAVPADVTLEAVRPLLEAADDMDVLLFGMGPDIAALDRAAREALESAGVGVEVMSTAAACRTFNVLLAEDRRVGAALLAV